VPTEKLNIAEVVFDLTYIEHPTCKFFYPLRKHRMYVPGWMFSLYYSKPEQEFCAGAIIAIAYLEKTPISVAIINLKPLEYVSPVIGFFTRKKYRKNGLAKMLGQLVFKQYTDLGHTSPLLAEDGSWKSFWTNWETAIHICQILKIPVIQI
jgi:hypothetical protein